jgi:hypothetical protein
MESIDGAERRAVVQLASALKGHLELTTEAFNIIGELLSSVPETRIHDLPASLRVAVKLMLRLSNDIRCTQILAVHGYPLQAMVLAGSAYEVAYTIAYIADDDVVACAWMEHDDPTCAFRPVQEMVRCGLAKLEVPGSETAALTEYRVYRQLCLAKHANPLLEARFGSDVRADTIVHVNGPDTSEDAVRAAWFALEHSAAAAFIATASFWKCHLPRCGSAGDLARLHAAIERVGARRKHLEAAAIARWGTEDPFAGRW